MNKYTKQTALSNAKSQQMNALTEDRLPRKIRRSFKNGMYHIAIYPHDKQSAQKLEGTVGLMRV
jgi:hypothetical protein